MNLEVLDRVNVTDVLHSPSLIYGHFRSLLKSLVKSLSSIVQVASDPRFKTDHLHQIPVH